MTPRQLRAVIHSKIPLHEGFLRVYQYEFDVEQHNGGVRRTRWEMMERGNAVAVLGHDPGRDVIVLANEFRPGAMVAGDYPYRDNLIAGTIGSNETSLEAAVREMKEETGLIQVAHPRRFPSYTARWTAATRGVFMATHRRTRTLRR